MYLGTLLVILGLLSTLYIKRQEHIAEHRHYEEKHSKQLETSAHDVIISINEPKETKNNFIRHLEFELSHDKDILRANILKSMARRSVLHISH